MDLGGGGATIYIYIYIYMFFFFGGGGQTVQSGRPRVQGLSGLAWRVEVTLSTEYCKLQNGQPPEPIKLGRALKP